MTPRQDQEGRNAFRGNGFPFEPPATLPKAGLPLLDKAVPAGFPSPADDYAEERIDLAAHIIEHPEASFFVRVQGHSMTGFGIHDGDLLLVDRAIQPMDRNIVIAVVDGAFTVKQLCLLPAGILLRAAQGPHSDILVDRDQSLVVWGVVRWSIHKVASCPDRLP